MKRLLLLAISLALMVGCASIPNPQPLNFTISTPSGNASIEKSDTEKINKSMEVKNHDLEFKNCKIRGDTVYMTIGNIGSWGSSGDDLWGDFQLIRLMGFKKLIIYLNSGGGQIYEGLAITDEIRILKNDGVNIEIHGRGIIASAAITVYLIANKRIASKNTTFMLHPMSIGKWGAFSETIDDIESQARMIQLWNDSYTTIVSENSKISKERARGFISKDTWINIEQAVEYGFVDEVR